jgi:hypothetical protein
VIILRVFFELDARATAQALGIAAYSWGMAPTAPSIHEQIDQGLQQHPAKKGLAFNLIVTAIEIGGSIALFQLAQGLGASDVVSYLVGSIGPVIGGFAIWAKARKFSGASAAIFAFTILSAVTALIGSTTPKALLYKDCVATAVIGLIFLGSCVVARKPVVFYMAQRYGTDGTHDGMAIFDKMWDNYRDFRTSMYVISGLWAGLFIVQAAGTALIISQSSYSTGYNYDQILPLVAVALGIIGSIMIGRYSAKKGKARGEAARAAACEAEQASRASQASTESA